MSSRIKYRSTRSIVTGHDENRTRLPPGYDGQASSDYNLYVVKPDGTLRWKFAAGNPVFSSPAFLVDSERVIGPEKRAFPMEPGTRASCGLPELDSSPFLPWADCSPK
jgi:hypothetical protein